MITKIMKGLLLKEGDGVCLRQMWGKKISNDRQWEALTEMANSKVVHFQTVTVSRRGLMSVYGLLEEMEMHFFNSKE